MSAWRGADVKAGLSGFDVQMATDTALRQGHRTPGLGRLQTDWTVLPLRAAHGGWGRPLPAAPAKPLLTKGAPMLQPTQGHHMASHDKIDACS